MKKALVLLAPGFEEIEAVTVIDILRRAGIKVSVAGLERDLVTGSHDISIKPDVFYLDIHQEDYDLLVLPGGQPGSKNLQKDETVLSWIKDRFGNGKKLAAICAAPTVFHAAGITGSLKITSHPSEKSLFSNNVDCTDSVVTDGSVITSRGVGTAIEFTLALVTELVNEETAADIRKAILYSPNF